MLNSLPDHFHPSVRHPPVRKAPMARVSPGDVNYPKATTDRPANVVATSAASLRVPPATTTPHTSYEPVRQPAGLRDLLGASGRAGRLGVRTIFGVGDSVAGSVRLLWRAAADAYARVASLGRRTDDPLLTLVEAAKCRALLNRINATVNLSSEERQIVEAISTSVRKTYQAGSEIVVEGEAILRPMFIASGLACRRRMRGNGRAQVVGFLAPGDGIGLRSVDTAAPFTIMALTTVETIDATQLLRLAQQSSRYAGIAEAMLKALAEDEVFLTNQIVRLGAASPVERLAHLLLEMHARLSLAGLATDRDFLLPMTYETLGEALALSPKVAMRAMKQLTRKGLAKFRYGRVKLMAPAELRRISDFSPPGSLMDRMPA